MSFREPSGKPAPDGFRASENLDPWLHDFGRLCRRALRDRDGALQTWLLWAVEIMRNMVASKMPGPNSLRQRIARAGGVKTHDPGVNFVGPTCTRRLNLGRDKSIIRAQGTGRKILARRCAAGACV